MKMFLAMDIGNTNTVLGIWQEGRWLWDWRIATVRSKTPDEYGVLISSLLENGDFNPGAIEDTLISSVVPPLNGVMEEALKNYLGLQSRFVGPGIKTGLNIKTENPREVGADRIVNAVATYHLYGAPAVIVDFGTATTFCALTARGEYLGGAIAPGVGISAAALFEEAAQLPRIKIRKPDHEVGSSTVSALESGIYYGFLGQIKELVTLFCNRLGGDPLVVATGGLASLWEKDVDFFDVVNPRLTLEGLRILGEMNRQ